MLCVVVFMLPGDIGEGLLPGSGGLQAKRVVSVHGGGCSLSNVIGRYHPSNLISELSPNDSVSVHG